VVGTDLSPIQPPWVPPNVEFQIDDAEEDWTWANESFDLIHIRHMTGAIQNWEKLIKQAYDHLKPGGYLEIKEYEMQLYCDDDSLKPDMPIYKFYDLVDKAAHMNGRGFRIAAQLEPLFTKAGFKDVHHDMYKLPVGHWPADPKLKEMGAFVLLSAENGFEAFGIKIFTEVFKMTDKEAAELIEGTMKNAKSRKVHCYCKQHIYWAQRPKK